METSSVSPAHIDSLTGLRFIAALLVYITHLPLSASLPEWTNRIMGAGYNGVTLFFVLSGFVICFNYFEPITTKPLATLRPYFVARFARIYPMYLFMFVWYFLSANLKKQFESNSAVILQQLTITQAWNPDITVAYSYNTLSWSVGVEAFLYLCFPFIAYFILKPCRKIWQILLIGFCAFGFSFGLATWFTITGNATMYGDTHYWLYRLPLTRLGDFIIGCSVARLYMVLRDKPVGKKEYYIASTLVVLAIAEIIFLMLNADTPFIAYRFDSGYILSFVFIIFYLARYKSLLRKLLSTKLLVLLGEASYSFYLLQGLWIAIARSRLITPGELGTYIYGVFIFGVLIVFSLGTYTFVETPARKWIRGYLSPTKTPKAPNALTK